MGTWGLIPFGLGLLRKLPLFYPKTKFVHYGTPNENALNAYNKIENFYESQIEIETLSKKYSFVTKMLNFLMPPKKLNHVEILSKKEMKQIDKFWEAKKTELEFAVIRSFDYLNWRIIDCPEKVKLFLLKDNEKTIGYFALKIKKNICYIFDILILNKYIKKDIFHEIEHVCKKHNVDEIQILTTDSLIKHNLHKIGFRLKNKTKLIYYNHIEKNVPINPYLTFSDFD